MVPDHELIRSLDRANRWLVKVDGMCHVHFTSTGIAVRSRPALAEKSSANKRTTAAWDAMAAATTSIRNCPPPGGEGGMWRSHSNSGGYFFTNSSGRGLRRNLNPGPLRTGMTRKPSPAILTRSPSRALPLTSHCSASSLVANV